MVNQHFLNMQLKSTEKAQDITKAFKSFKLEFLLVCVLAVFDKMIIPPFIQNASELL
jgi:MFS family permease